MSGPEAGSTLVRASAAVWAGRVLSGLVVAFLLMDAALKLFGVPEVAATMRQLGWPTDATSIRILAASLLAFALLYVTPRTEVLGAVLLTAYLGGAVATHARLDDPLFSHTLFGVYVGVLAWAGLWLRRPAVRALLTPWAVR